MLKDYVPLRKTFQTLKGSLSTNVHCAPRYLLAAIFCATKNSDLTRLKEKAYLSVDFVYLSNVLKVLSIKCLPHAEEILRYSVECFVTNKL